MWRAASGSDVCGVTVSTFVVMTELTGVWSRSAPRATAFIRSRSVTMPMSLSPSMTSRDPVCCFHFRSAADLSPSDGESTTLAPVMMSATCTPAGYRRSGLELVAEAADGEQVAGLGRVRLDLGAQPLDVHVEGLRVADVVAAPHPIDQLPAGQHPAAVAEQELQQLELLQRQRHL